MMKKISFFILIFVISCSAYAQVGINTKTPHASTALDITSPDNNKGILIPRMDQTHKTAINNPAEGLLVYDTTLKCISQNAGTTASPAWVCLSTIPTQAASFYMPSIAIDASSADNGKTLNLYDEYKKQFSGEVPAQFAKSNGAPATIPYYPAATSLYYYITYYDPDILSITSIDDNGLVTYDVLQEADYSSFINVVFVIK